MLQKTPQLTPQFHEELKEVELCVKGLNWGEAKLRGSLVSFCVDTHTGVWNTTPRDFSGHTYTHCILRIVWLLRTAQYPCRHGRDEISHPIHRRRRGPSNCVSRKSSCQCWYHAGHGWCLWRFGDTISYTKVAHGSTQIQACICLGSDLYLFQYQTIPISVPIHICPSAIPAPVHISLRGIKDWVQGFWGYIVAKFRSTWQLFTVVTCSPTLNVCCDFISGHAHKQLSCTKPRFGCVFFQCLTYSAPLQQPPQCSTQIWKFNCWKDILIDIMCLVHSVHDKLTGQVRFRPLSPRQPGNHQLPRMILC